MEMNKKNSTTFLSGALVYYENVLMVSVVMDLSLLAEQLGGAVVPEEQSPSPLVPALFKEVGPLVDDWEKYLRNMAEDLDQQHTDVSSRQEHNIFLQVD